MTAVDFDPAPSSALEDLTGDYRLDLEHSRIGFIARHAMVTSVRGAFAEFEGTAHLDSAHPVNSSAEICVEVTSLSTGNDQRDAHLRSADFFDAATYPKLTFTSTAVEHVGENIFRLTGDLTIKDLTRPIAVELTFIGSSRDPYGALRAGFEGRATINRRDWGLSWNAVMETGGLLVSDKIKLELDVSAVKVLAVI